MGVFLSRGLALSLGFRIDRGLLLKALAQCLIEDSHCPSSTSPDASELARSSTSDCRVAGPLRVAEGQGW
ncbi:hypothetical protein GCM10025867_46560 (plasmid) [Frondihabitans sucicola]|uniref:Secreted protein n=1 Tax=Frondihabitans sucicola TaxID=1268041 RepID=A0ABM8GVC0_9MICO|nr:hypothetical protein GCM10025867_46560 [Frondihabitans sucicola]